MSSSGRPPPQGSCVGNPRLRRSVRQFESPVNWSCRDVRFAHWLWQAPDADEHKGCLDNVDTVPHDIMDDGEDSMHSGSLKGLDL